MKLCPDTKLGENKDECRAKVSDPNTRVNAYVPIQSDKRWSFGPMNLRIGACMLSMKRKLAEN